MEWMLFDKIGNVTVDPNYRPIQNVTIGWIELTQHVTVDIVVIPEIPSPLVLLLFMMLMLSVIILYKKNHWTY